MENYEHIFYLDCPHFAVGRPDQWGEHGYLLFDGKIYFYEIDRKCQCQDIHRPMTVGEFLTQAEEQKILIPDDFMLKLQEAPNLEATSRD